MKWLIIQSDGQHKGQDNWVPNWFLRECYSLQDALLRNGQMADIWGLRHANFGQIPDFDSYDVILLAENYEWDWVPDLGKFKHPKIVQWIIDLHCQGWENYVKFSEQADLVLHATKGFIRNYAYTVCQPTDQHAWFPNAIDDRYFRSGPLALRTEDLIFIGGRGPKRDEVLSQMEKHGGLTYHYGITGYEYIRRLQQCKIGFNKNIGGDINYRTFEVIATGACLLTEFDQCLLELGFVHNSNCLLYQNVDHALRLLEWARENRNWQRIAEEGLKLAKEHTYTKRIEQLLKRI